MSDLILLKDVPNLETDYEPTSIDLQQEYWTPTDPGDSKRAFFWGIENRKCRDEKTDEEIELPCVILVVQDEDGNLKSVANGSKRLVGIFESNDLEQETPVEITFKGKKKNKTNSNSSDTWSVVVLGKKGSSNA